MHYRFRNIANEIRSFLEGQKHLDPVYGPNSWRADPDVAADPVREERWRIDQRDRAFWEYQRELVGLIEMIHRKLRPEVQVSRALSAAFPVQGCAKAH